MLKYVCSRKRAQPRLVNLTFGVVCVTRMAGMAAIEFSMRRGLTPQRPEGFGEGELAGREPGYRLSRRRGVMPLLLFATSIGLICSAADLMFPRLRKCAGSHGGI